MVLISIEVCSTIALLLGHLTLFVWNRWESGA
jgi:hypothetical protein